MDTCDAASGCVLAVPAHSWHTLGSLGVHGPDPLERGDSSGIVVEHFYFICFSQWAAVFLSEVCSGSQSWFRVYPREEDLQESREYASQRRGSHLAAPYHARCFWLRRGLSLQKSLLLEPFRNMGLLFFNHWAT